MGNPDRQVTKEELALGVWLGGIVINLTLCVVKFIGGIIGMSAVLLADALRSVTDVLTDLSLLAEVDVDEDGVEDDSQVPWKKAAVCLWAALLMIVSVWFGFQGAVRLLNPFSYVIPTPGIVAGIVALAAILVKHRMFGYVKSVAWEIKSSAVMADAWRHRAEGMWSVVSLAGVAGVWLGFPYLELLAIIVLCFTIARDSLAVIIDMIL